MIATQKIQNYTGLANPSLNDTAIEFISQIVRYHTDRNSPPVR